jgi:ABC-type multidrug transport system fused ATPase/permease subunit
MSIAMLFPIFIVVAAEDIQSNHTISQLYNNFNFKSEGQFIVALCCITLFLFLLKSFIFYLSKRIQANYSFSLFEYFTSNNFQQISKRDYNSLKKTSSKEILRDVSHLPRTFSGWVVLPTLVVINEILVLLIIFSVLIYFYSYIVIIVLIPIVLSVMTFYYLIRKRLNLIERELNQLLPKNIESVLDAIQGFEDIYISQNQSFFFKKYEALVKREKQLSVYRAILSELPARVTEFGVLLSIITIMLYCFYYIPDPIARVSLLGVFGLATFRSTPSINKILTAIVKIKGKQFVLEIFEKWKYTETATKEENIIPFEKSIELKNASFYFDDKKIFDQINFKIKKGEFAGIVGPSGAGKSTLLKTILQLYPLSKGQIIIDDEVLCPQHNKSWLSKIGYVGQEVFLVDGSIKENILFGNQLDQTQLDSAIKMAGLSDFVHDLDDGVDHLVGENGAAISGGQRQRIGIARALYNKPQILVLDESTNALDSDIEKEIIASITELNKIDDLTIIFITHKKSNLASADQIIELAIVSN